MSLRWFIFSAEEVKRKFIAELENGGIIRNIQGLTKPAPRKEAETYELVSEIAVESLLLIGLSSWFWAQLIKTIIHAIVTKSIDFTRLIGDGGMPSGHSATVSSLATAAALVYGLGSFEFAMAFIFAIVVCKDAMGVRLETGRQAVIINDIVEAFNSLASEKLPEAKLKEFVGHTPLQVIAGILLGVANTFIMYYCVL